MTKTLGSVNTLVTMQTSVGSNASCSNQIQSHSLVQQPSNTCANALTTQNFQQNSKDMSQLNNIVTSEQPSVPNWASQDARNHSSNITAIMNLETTPSSLEANTYSQTENFTNLSTNWDSLSLLSEYLNCPC